MVYSSILNNKIKDIKKLQTKKYRDKEELFLIEGEHLVKEAIKSNCLKELYVLENSNLKFDFKINYVTENVIKYLSELNTPSNVIGVCEKRNCEVIGNKIVYLDNIQDPGNLGTIIRSCVAFNASTLVLNNCVDLYNSKVIRATQGLLFHLNIVDNISLLELKNNGYKILGTKVTNGKNIKEFKNNDKLVIVMGNEGKGISEETSKLCDEFIYINMNKKCESLNVGVATSIILYELDDLK